MASTEQIINFIAYFVSVYVGYLVVISGLIGNIINILVFTQLKLFRQNQSAFYLTIASIVDCVELIFASATRSAATSSGFDPTRISLVWCKLRIYFIQFGAITSVITVCFAAIDQYLSTSYYARLRQMSTYKLTQRLIVILIIFAALYSIPFLIFQDIGYSAVCSTFNPIFNYFYSFVHLCVVIGFLPIVISSFFSFLAYQNVRRIIRRQTSIVRRRLDRQLTAMILVRVALFVITTLPFVCYRTYEINKPVNQNNTLAVAIDQLIRAITNIIYNINYSGSFYVFFISSIRYRRQVKYLLLKRMWRRCLSKMVTRNQTVPENEIPITRPQESSIETD